MNKPLILKKKIAIEDVQQRKMELLNDIRLQEESIAILARNIINPPREPAPAAFMFGNTILNKFNKGVVIFDGVFLGIKIYKSIRRLFKRRR